MVPITRLYADANGHARFEDVEIALFPGDPPPPSWFWTLTAIRRPIPRSPYPHLEPGAPVRAGTRAPRRPF